MSIRTLPLHAGTALVALSLAGSALAAPGHAHAHGAATIDIAVEPGRITVQMATPLANLLAFERAPRTDAERKRVDAAVASLQAAGSLFKIDPAAGCTLGAVSLTSAALKLGTADPAGQAEPGHADLDGDFEFTCTDGTRAAFIDLGLFDRFAGLQRIEVQLAAVKGQARRTLQRPASRITLPR